MGGGVGEVLGRSGVVLGWGDLGRWVGTKREVLLLRKQPC